jgi:hypothetical protein
MICTVIGCLLVIAIAEVDEILRAAYHDLPVEMPMEAHQGIMAANALAEGNGAASRLRHRESVEIVQGGLPGITTGRTVVDTVSAGANSATKQIKDTIRRFRFRR